MDEKKQVPRMMTTREVAQTGILPEHALRQLIKQGKVPHIMCGNRPYINYDRLVEMLESL